MTSVEGGWSKAATIATWIGALGTVVAVLVTVFLPPPPPPPNQPTELDIIAEFQRLYSDEKSRRLAAQTIRSFSTPCGREAMRRFVVWDVLERHITAGRLAPAEGRFRFDSEHPDWHLLGDVVVAMRDDDGCSGNF